MQLTTRLLLTALVFTCWDNSLLQSQSPVPDRLAIQDVCWSPDGKKLAFSVLYGKADWSDFKPENWQLLVYTLKTKKTQLVASGAVFAAFSPDGHALAYSKYRGEGNWDIEIQDLHTGLAHLLTTDSTTRESGPSWSPDGRHLVFFGGNGEQRELFVINSDGSGLKQISKAAPHKCFNPCWSPNSDRICYYLEKGDHRDQIYLTDSNGSFHQNLSRDTLHNYYPGWAPENRIIHASNDETLRIMQADGSGKVILNGVASFYGRIDPKGKKIAYIQKAGPTQALALCKFPVRGNVEKLFTLQEYKILQAALESN
ncbi:MAG: PD40 domain-containing protein [Lewinellaceae bacterium]|nr:PD40 domain-containing protein [Lewinellaceae bacterium]